LSETLEGRISSIDFIVARTGEQNIIYTIFLREMGVRKPRELYQDMEEFPIIGRRRGPGGWGNPPRRCESQTTRRARRKERRTSISTIESVG
jgi:hypothetical protein